MLNSRLKAAAVGAVVLIVAFSGCSNQKTVSAPPEIKTDVPVTVKLVNESAFTEYGEYYGRTEPSSGATLVAPAGGRVQSIRVSEGDAVRSGESLGGIALDRAQAIYEAAVLNERIAKDSYLRQKDFLDSGTVSRVAVDQAELAWRSAKSALIDADTVLKGARAESPLDGIVLSRKIELHEELPPGAPTFSVGDISKLLVKIGIPESDIGGVRQGAGAKVTFSAFPGEEWKGEITRIDREPSAKTLTFSAAISLANPGQRLLPGVTAKVVIPKRVIEAAIVVPTEAIIASDSGSYAMVARNEDGRWVARKVPVERGASNLDSTHIRSGLNVGDRLIIEGNHLAQDGSAVTIAERVALGADKNRK
jgi:membrane fusion protein, multidrug efflux system